MSSPAEKIELCSKFLIQLGWDWDHPRVQQWFDRVSQRLYKMPYTPETNFPLGVWNKLVNLLYYRHECDRALKNIGADWTYPEVIAIERKYRCVGEMPLAGYEELHDILFDKVPF